MAIPGVLSEIGGEGSLVVAAVQKTAAAVTVRTSGGRKTEGGKQIAEREPRFDVLD